MEPDFNITLFTIGFCLITVSGFYLAYLYGHAVKRFRWSEYFFVAFWPLFVISLASYLIDIKFLYLFVASAVVGMTAEYLLGYAWHQILNRRLWTYSRMSLNGYTSFLTIPFWGNAGIVFLIIIKLIGF